LGIITWYRTIAKYPNDYYAFVGTGQVGNQPKSDSLSYQFVIKKAREKNDTAALNELNKIGEYSAENLIKIGVINWYSCNELMYQNLVGQHLIQMRMLMFLYTLFYFAGSTLLETSIISLRVIGIRV